MSNTETATAPGCTNQTPTGPCGRPVQAKGLCQAHYRRMLRGSDAEAPLRLKRGDLHPLSLRVTAATAKELERAGGAYRIGSEVLENWAADQASKRLGVVPPRKSKARA